MSGPLEITQQTHFKPGHELAVLFVVIGLFDECGEMVKDLFDILHVTMIQSDYDGGGCIGERGQCPVECLGFVGDDGHGGVSE